MTRTSLINLTNLLVPFLFILIVRGQTINQIDINKYETTIPFAGNWINENYFNKIIETKSPLKSQEECTDCFIFIPDKTLQVVEIVCSSYHEGCYGQIKKFNDSYQLWNESAEKVDRIKVLSDNKIKIGDKTFVKIKPHILKLGEFREPLILEEILFKGNYKTMNGHRVEFKNDGTVSGLDSITRYSPLIDYYDVGLNIDQVRIGTIDKISKEKNNQDILTDSNSKRFGFKFNHDTLALYKLNCLKFSEDKECVEVTFGQLILELLKENNRR